MSPAPAITPTTPLAPPEQRSLFGKILDWMLAPLVLLWPMSMGLTWVVAQTIADRPFDRELADLVRALARQPAVQSVPATMPLAQRRAGIEGVMALLIRDDDEDRSYYQVIGGQGELVAGIGELEAPPPGAGTAAGDVSFRDDQIGDEPVRVASLRLAGADPSPALVQVAQTLGKRSRLTTEIIKGVILPQCLILPLAVLLVRFALARGIRPLADLQWRIRRRESTDLSAIAEGDVPDEVVPLVRASNDLLKRLDQGIAAQRHFLADAAHQLKTPLAGLITQAELAAREIDSGRIDPASMMHALRQIAHSTQRAAHMVDQLLAMARAEDAGQSLRRRPVDLAELTRAVVRDFFPRAIERRIDLGFEGPEPAAATRLLAEPILLGELVRNLVDNALHYTPPGGSVTVRVWPEADGTCVVLQVEDTGPGIEPGDREAVFRAFYRAPGNPVDGSGLGLAIVHEVAERHAAEVRIDDARPRDGTTPPGALFSVRFPAAATPLPTLAKPLRTP